MVRPSTWAVFEPHLPRRGRGPKRVDNRRVLNGTVYILRTGAPWRDLPECWGAHTINYNVMPLTGRRGVWRSSFEALAH
ncbi:MAG: transposase [Magnetovibrio sp.]|nr:transposase [Magnetovibrio sp.]